MVKYRLNKERFGTVKSLQKLDLYLATLQESRRIIQECRHYENAEVIAEYNDYSVVFLEKEAIRDGTYYNNVFYIVKGTIPYLWLKAYKITVEVVN